MTMTYALKITTIGFVALLLALLALLSLRGLIDPQSAATSFGVPVDDPAARLYQMVYRSRNLIIAVSAIVFLVAGMWRALAILTTAAVALPVFDIVALKAAQMPVTAVHPLTLVALVAASALLWLYVRAAGPADRI